MQTTDLKTSRPDKDDGITQAKLTSFIRLHDLHHPVIITNTYLADARSVAPQKDRNANDDLIMQDLFGALDY